MTDEQSEMHNCLQRKKEFVVSSLIQLMNHRNRDSIEDSLNAMYILIEMVEVEKTFDIFMVNDGDKIGEIIELAVDCENEFN